MTRVAVDVMGGDRGVAAAVTACHQVASSDQGLQITVVGDRAAINAQLPPESSVTVVAADCAISMHDTVVDALRRRRGSSLHRALHLLKDGAVDAVVSAGNTAALVAVGRQLLGTVGDVSRPAICSRFPTRAGHTWLLDLGANVAVSAATLHQFARMGSALASVADHCAAPRVALLNIGTEIGKGSELVQSAKDLMETDDSLNFVGFVEGDAIFNNVADVIVCDGFTGNVALKVCEGTAAFIGQVFRDSVIAANMSEEVLAAVTPAFKDFAAAINPHNYAGASLLGLDGVLVKTHGNSGAGSFVRAIELAALEAAERLPEKLSLRLASNPS